MRRTGLMAMAIGLQFVYAVSLAVAQPPPVSFAPHVDFPVGGSPFDVVTGDFNLDGFTDIASANNFTDNVTVLLGNGDGTFLSTGPFPAELGGAPSAIEAGDVNNDGFADLIVANEIANTVSVLLGKDDGTFQDATNVRVGTSPEGVVVADLNGDGNLDVATADLFDDTVSVILGNGDGTFGAVQTAAVTGGPFGIGGGDFNNDSIVDLAVSAIDAGVISILVGNGDGTFEAAQSVTVGISPAGLTVVDLDLDGNLDVAVANEDSDSVSVLLGVGDGTFTDAQDFDVGGFPESVAAADFNDDGIPDLITADSFGTAALDNSVSVLPGLGDGTFAPAQSFEVNVSPFGVAVGDFNGDDRPDVATANADSDDVSVLLNTGGPSCVGDCDGGGGVTVDELVRGVNIALGNLVLSECSVFDRNRDGRVTVDELVSGVNNALNGCPA